MFQTYDDVADPSLGRDRLALLQAELSRLGLTGFIVPRADEHQGEYVPACAERLQWLTGFTGSAGTCVLTISECAIFVDGRYTLQVRDQVDLASFTPVSIEDISVHDWLRRNARAIDRIGYDPALHPMSAIKRLEEAAKEAGATLVALDRNPVDTVWADRPATPLGPVTLQPLELTGETAAAKLARLAADVAAKGAAAAILTQPDSIAWLFNIRGCDVPHTPFALSHAILAASGRSSLFIDGRKLDATVRAALAEVADLHEPDAFAAALAALGEAEAAVMVDPAWVSAAIASRLTRAGARLIEADDPCRLPKATKTAAEIAGTRAAHRRDGAAMARFLAWFDAHSLDGTLDEIAVCQALEQFRAETGPAIDGERGRLLDLSFSTISGAGPNGAIVHYRSTRATSRPLDRDNLFLLDSGGQYRDGTTDITRTLAVGTPTAEMRDRFTRVLKGMIAVATARFPKGTTGHQLDTLARSALWSAGLDYDHGTGHGVGSFLSVHEGPQNISKRAAPVALEPGMIVSDEPGFYKTGHWGIRVENLILVTKAELAWINAYHARVATEISPLLAADERAWLAQATAAL